MGKKPSGKGGPWRGPSHLRNQRQGKPATLPQKAMSKQQKPLTQQRDHATRREQPFDYYLVIDFECTCEMEDRTWPHEIIEFPAVLMAADTGELVAEFHRFCRPAVRPELTAFCKNLTGIQQKTVDEAEPLVKVVAQFCEWLVASVPEGATVCCATDGPTDLETFMYRMAIKRDGVRFPEVCFTYVDVKLTFQKYFKVRTKPRLPVMIREMKLKFEGVQHSGIDDTRNIARLMNAMMDRGVVFSYPLAIKHKPAHVLGEITEEFAVLRSIPEDALRLLTADERAVDDGDQEGAAAAAVGDSNSGDDDDAGNDAGQASVTPSSSPPASSGAAAAAAAADEDDGDASGGDEAGFDAGEGSGGDDAGPSSAATKTSRPKPKVIKRDLDHAREVREGVLRQRRADAALASPEDIATARVASGTGTASTGGVRSVIQKFNSVPKRVKVLFGLAALSTVNLLAAVWMTASSPEEIVVASSDNPVDDL